MIGSSAVPSVMGVEMAAASSARSTRHALLEPPSMLSTLVPVCRCP